MPPPAVPRTKAGSVPTSTSATQSPLSKSPTSPLSKSPMLKPLTQANPQVPTLSAEGHDALAEAISKIDTLRMSQPPSAASTPPDSNPATSNPASRRASQVALGSSFSEKRFYSPPATPHFGAQTNLCVLLAFPADEQSQTARRQHQGHPPEPRLERWAQESAFGLWYRWRW